MKKFTIYYVVLCGILLPQIALSTEQTDTPRKHGTAAVELEVVNQEAKKIVPLGDSTSVVDTATSNISAQNETNSRFNSKTDSSKSTSKQRLQFNPKQE
jgi:hypothetical protein